MTNAAIKSVFLLTVGNEGNTPTVNLARGDQAGIDPVYFNGNMSYSNTAIDILDADFPAEPTNDTISVAIFLTDAERGTHNEYIAHATSDPAGNKPLTFASQTISQDKRTLTLTFIQPGAGETTGYIEMYFHTLMGVIDPQGESERDPS